MAGRSLVALAVAGFAVALLSLCSGSAGLPVADTLQALWGIGEPRAVAIVRDLRLPRALLALTVGMALSGAGCAFQAVFRNPLAEPFVLGISGGAALGSVAASLCGLGSVLGPWALALGAFAGAATIAGTAVAVASRNGRAGVADLLLAGFALGSLCSALVALLLLVAGHDLAEILLWMLGSLERADAWARLRVAAPATGLALLFLWWSSRDLDLLLLGEDSARQLGIDSERVKRRVLAAGVLAAATAVAACGVIGFVGLIVPHAARSVLGPAHARLLPIAAVAGGVFLMATDLLARSTLERTGGLPVGSVTALLGAPFFLLLLVRGRRSALGGA
jgi:iron complex transport system permease protein